MVCYYRRFRAVIIVYYLLQVSRMAQPDSEYINPEVSNANSVTEEKYDEFAKDESDSVVPPQVNSEASVQEVSVFLN